MDDGTDEPQPAQTQSLPRDAETPQLQRPQFARQMSAQQARNSPTIEQMRRLQIAQDQQSGTPAWSPQGEVPCTQLSSSPTPTYSSSAYWIGKMSGECFKVSIRSPSPSPLVFAVSLVSHYLPSSISFTNPSKRFELPQIIWNF